MNKERTSRHIRAETVPMITGREPPAVRLARAVAIIQAIGQAPTPGLVPLPHTEKAGDPNAPGFVYFAYCAGRIKIGYTSDVGERMRGIATSSPFPLTLLLTFPGTPEDEIAYHGMFDEDRANLEWFDLSWELREFLSAHFGYGTHELLENAEDEFAASCAVFPVIEIVDVGAPRNRKKRARSRVVPHFDLRVRTPQPGE